MMELLSSLSRKWLICVVILSQIIGSVWYMFLFSKAYQQELKAKPMDPEQAKAMMPKLMLLETLSRLLYFIGLGIIVTYTGQMDIWTVAFYYFLAVLTTEWSGVIWSENSRKLWAMRAGKIAVDTVIAVWLYAIL